MTKTITIGSKEYPMRASLGAMRMFKAETGREISEIKDSELSELAAFLWCCVAAECRYRKIEFGYTLDEFCDALEPSDLVVLSEEAKKEERKEHHASKSAKKK